MILPLSLYIYIYMLAFLWKSRRIPLCLLLLTEVSLLYFFFWGSYHMQSDFFIADPSGWYLHLTPLFAVTYLASHAFFVNILLERRALGAKILFYILRGNAVFLCILLAFAASVSERSFSWSMVGAVVGLHTLCVLLLRFLFRCWWKYQVKKNKHNKKNILVGDAQHLEAFFKDGNYKSFVHSKCWGYFSASAIAPKNTQYPHYLGDFAACEAYLQQQAQCVKRLYFVLPCADDDSVKRIVQFCENNLIRFVGLPYLGQYLAQRNITILSHGVPMMHLRKSPLDSVDNRYLKRLFDLLFSAAFLLLFFPLIYLVFGTLIKLSSPGPVFFKQKRSGLNGKEFWCYKFRSMRVNPNCDQMQATQNDPRKTSIGNFMRRTNIDEVPQFFNVLRGEMSIVGPRPHMLKHTEEYRFLIDKYMLRHFVKPGITGWAQVTGYRGETKALWQMEERVHRDIWYIENWSFTLDLWIMLRTLFNWNDKNAY